ncbi:MAG: hypothetical protein ACFE0I_18950 [Elainellaceae cyanobacterium]
MKYLLKGVQIYCDPHNPVSESKIWLSSGTFPASLSNMCRYYANDAVLPAEPWRLPNSSELSILITQTIPRNFYGSCVALTRIPDNVLSPLRKLGVDSLKSPGEQRQCISSPEYQLGITRVLDYLRPFHLSNHTPIVAGLAINPPNMPTVTYNSHQQFYIGLHLDSWDHMPLQDRHLSTNRICINLGQHDRFFLFLNLPLVDILYTLILLESNKFAPSQQWINWKWKFRKFKPIQGLIRTTPPQHLKRRFLETYSSYPIIKVRVAPGEAYIAPTENIIHDGCSIGQNDADVHLTMRGYFHIPS